MHTIVKIVRKSYTNYSSIIIPEGTAILSYHHTHCIRETLVQTLPHSVKFWTHVAAPRDASDRGPFRVEEGESCQVGDDGTHHYDVVEVGAGQTNQSGGEGQ